jgi:hypothetical protein
MDQELKTHLDAMEARLLAHTEAVEARLRDHTEAVETRLLAEFWKWARTADARYRQAQGVVGLLDERVLAVEDRISDPERRRAS